MAGRGGRAGRRRSVWERLYLVGVSLKGVDGAVELTAGLLIWLAPGLVHTALLTSATEATESDARVSSLAAEYLLRADAALALQTTTIAVVFLVVHGVVKLVTVVCLLREWLRAYPFAIAALVALTAFQLDGLVSAPSPSAIALAVLDVVIIALVVHEYRVLRRRPAEARVAAR